ncbi:MAG: RDD family protein [Clostridiales bacterium]|nr:RDD family protein [Clostridiales bacterium]
MKNSIKDNQVIIRFKALFFDWLFICAYLLLLFLIASVFYFVLFSGIPKFTNFQSQFIATISSVVPIITIFSVMEGKKNFATIGKRMANLKVQFKDQSMRRSIIRNTIKFLPWQFGHMSTINGIYNGFETFYSMLFFTLSMMISFILVLMVLVRKDKRHLADFIAGSRVVHNGGVQNARAF